MSLVFDGLEDLPLLAIEHAPRAGSNQAVRPVAALFLEAPHRLLDIAVEHSLLGSVGRRHLEPLPQQRHLLMLDAKLEHRPIRDPDDAVVLDMAAARRDQRLAQGLKLRLVRLEAPQIGGGL